jgi:hypothetical protein
MMRTDIRVGLCLLAVLTLAGCTAAPSSALPPPSAEGSGSASSEASSETSPDASSETSPDTEAVSYPVGFPVDEVPMFDGELLHVAHPGNIWAAWIASDDLVADLATATADLIDAGFTVTAQAEGYAELTKADRVLRLVASVDGTYGSCLAYTFTDGMEAAPDQPAPEPGSESESESEKH